MHDFATTNNDPRRPCEVASPIGVYIRPIWGHWAVKAIIALLINAAVFSFFCIQYASQRAETYFCQLLLGRSNVHIDAIEIRDAANRIIIQDQPSVSYLTRMFRRARLDHLRDGESYFMDISLHRLGTVRCRICIPAEVHYLVINFPIGNYLDDGDYYLIPLQEPIPKYLLDILSNLNSNSEQPSRMPTATSLP